MIKVCTYIASLSGVQEPCEIEFSQGVQTQMEVRSQRFGVLLFTDETVFGALSKFRLRLEQDGYLLLCNAARRDAYPSRMALEMGGGRKIYLLKPETQAKREDLVDVFGAASINQVCTVAEQHANYMAWIRSLK